MPDEPQEELRPDGAEAQDEGGPHDAHDAPSSEPTTVEKVIEAYRDVNRESVEVARQALAIPELNEATKRAFEAFRPPNAFLDMMENQARISRMLRVE